MSSRSKTEFHVAVKLKQYGHVVNFIWVTLMELLKPIVFRLQTLNAQKKKKKEILLRKIVLNCILKFYQYFPGSIFYP